MNRSEAADLPDFAYPVIAWAPVAATGDPYDHGERAFLAPRDVTRIYFPESDLRLGWTFVDVKGRSWEVLSSRVFGRADPWWARALPRWLHSPSYKLAYEFADRTPVSFDAVKTRLFASVTENPQAYDRQWARSRRAELRAARSLSDLIKSEEARAIERLQPQSLRYQWLTGEGRCSRRAFVAAGLVAATLVWIDVTWGVPMPGFLLLLLLVMMLTLSIVVRRLHDMGRPAAWIGAWFAFTMVCACAHDWIQIPVVKTVAAFVWQAVTLGLVGYLAVAPGSAGSNRYGLKRPADSESASPEA